MSHTNSENPQIRMQILFDFCEHLHVLREAHGPEDPRTLAAKDRLLNVFELLTVLERLEERAEASAPPKAKAKGKGKGTAAPTSKRPRKVPIEGEDVSAVNIQDLIKALKPCLCSTSKKKGITCTEYTVFLSILCKCEPEALQAFRSWVEKQPNLELKQPTGFKTAPSKEYIVRQVQRHFGEVSLPIPFWAK